MTPDLKNYYNENNAFFIIGFTCVHVMSVNSSEYKSKTSSLWGGLLFRWFEFWLFLLQAAAVLRPFGNAL